MVAPARGALHHRWGERTVLVRGHRGLRCVVVLGGHRLAVVGRLVIVVDGRHGWDGGIVSNTPLEYILDCRPHEDTLVFQVDLWSARGERPRTMMDVLERIKDIRYSSRTRHGTQMVEVAQKLRTSLKELIDRLNRYLLQAHAERRRAIGDVRFVDEEPHRAALDERQRLMALDQQP